MTIQERFETYIKEARMMQLATSSHGKPWICSVFFAYDAENNVIYWLSELTRRHSRELMENEQVAAAVVKPHDPKSKEKQGFQIEGIAYRCLGAELERAYAVFAKQYGVPEKVLERAKQGDEKAATFWCLKPAVIVTFDTINYPNDPVQQQAF